jgi:hypothetical protein
VLRVLALPHVDETHLGHLSPVVHYVSCIARTNWTAGDGWRTR